MDFAKELIRKKMVPLGFSYNGLVVIIRKKIENGELQKKKDLYQFLSHYLVLHQSDKVLEIINQYTYIYTSVHKEKNILRTNKNYHDFLQQLFLCYLKQDQIDVGLVRYQYLQNLVLEHSFQRRLEKIYARNLEELKDIIACLSSEEQIKIRGFYNFQKDHRIEIKISYGFSFLILARIMKDDSLNLKKELSYSAFDEAYVKYYQMFLDKMGLSLNHIKQICSLKQNQEKLAYVFQYQKYDGKYPVDEVVRVVEDAIRKIQQMEYLSLESLVSNEKEEFIQGIFLYLKQAQPEYYRTILSFGDLSLKEYNNLSMSEKKLYRDATAKMTEIITEVKTSLIWHEMINILMKDRKFDFFSSFLGSSKSDVLLSLEQLKGENSKYYAVILKRHGENLKQWHALTSSENAIYLIAMFQLQKRLQKPVITLFDKFLGTPRQEVLRVLEQMKDDRPQYYAIIYKRHGDSLEEWRELVRDENVIYRNAINSMRTRLQKSAITLFDKFPETPRQEVLRVLEQMKDDRPKYYAIIYKRHGKSLEEWHELTSDECIVYASAINSMRAKLQKSVTTLFDKFSETSRQEVLRVLEQMKDDRPQYYAIIYKRHGKSLEEWHELTSDECIVYASAINSMRAKLQKSVTTLFDKFPETPRQEVLRVLEQMKDNKPQYYAIIYKRHGKSLEEWHELARDECYTYFLSIEYLKRKIQYQRLVKKEIYSEAKEILKEQKEQLFLVRDIRNGLLTQEIQEKYHLSFLEIFDFYFQTLLLYDEETVIRIIYECFLYHCQNKLLQSSYYQLLLKQSSNTDIERILNQVVSQLELQGVEVRNTNKYIRRKKRKKD